MRGGEDRGKAHSVDDVLVDGAGSCLFSSKLHTYHFTLSLLGGFLFVLVSVTSIQLNILETPVQNYILQLEYSWVKPYRITEGMSSLNTA